MEEITALIPEIQQPIQATTDQILNDIINDVYIKTEAEFDIQLFGLYFFPHYFYKESSNFHHELINYFESRKKEKRTVIAAPRGHGKSSFISFLFPIWCLAYRKKRFILLLSDTSSQAESLLSDIIEEIESNSSLRAFFPELMPALDERKQYIKWTDSEINLANGTKMLAKQTHSKLRGVKDSAVRPDLLILDDCENDEMVLTIARRNKLKSWFDKVVMNVGDINGFDVIMCGNILHYDCLLRNVMNRKQFESQEFKAIIDEDKKEVLWSAVWSYEKLLAKRDEIGSIAFRSEYQNEVVSEEDAVFKLQDFNFYTERDMEFSEVYFGVDLAISESAKADYTVIVVIGVKDNKFYVLDVWRGRVKFHDILLTIENMATLWKPLSIGIEDVAFQKSVLQELIRTTKLPVKSVKVTKDKRIRAIALSVYFEQGKVFVRDDMVDFVDEFVSFPIGSHDDRIDALGHAVWTSIQHRPKKKKKPLKVQNLNINNLKGLKW